VTGTPNHHDPPLSQLLSRREPAAGEQHDRLLTAGEVAEFLAVPESWVREATRDGRLPHLTLGRYRRYARAAIEAWLEGQQAGPWPRLQPAKRRDLHQGSDPSL
jgi:excisionase family DNA binding protein